MYLQQISLQVQTYSNCLAHNSDKNETAAIQTAVQNQTQQSKEMGTASPKVHTTHITTVHTSAFNGPLQGLPEASNTP